MKLMETCVPLIIFIDFVIKILYKVNFKFQWIQLQSDILPTFRNTKLRKPQFINMPRGSSEI